MWFWVIILIATYIIFEDYFTTEQLVKFTVFLILFWFAKDLTEKEIKEDLKQEE